MGHDMAHGIVLCWSSLPWLIDFICIFNISAFQCIFTKFLDLFFTRFHPLSHCLKCHGFEQRNAGRK